MDTKTLSLCSKRSMELTEQYLQEFLDLELSAEDFATLANPPSPKKMRLDKFVVLPHVTEVLTPDEREERARYAWFSDAQLPLLPPYQDPPVVAPPPVVSPIVSPALLRTPPATKVVKQRRPVSVPRVKKVKGTVLAAPRGGKCNSQQQLLKRRIAEEALRTSTQLTSHDEESIYTVLKSFSACLSPNSAKRLKF